jgi:ABC-type Na+ efflux pump permease subunit
MNSQFGAGVWPVVQRELREGARRRWGYRLRIGAAMGGVLCFFSLFSNANDAQSQSEMATKLFDKIHVLLLDLICAIVPALTADCLAREKREGTLGLLFLTPLSSSGIVLGKILARTLRVLTVWLAVVPMLLIPLLIGNVTWTDVITFLVLELCAGMLCLAAGVLASSLTESRPIAFILAFILAASFISGAIECQHWRMLRNARTLPWALYRASPAAAPSFVAELSTAAPAVRSPVVGRSAVAAAWTTYRVSPAAVPSFVANLPSAAPAVRYPVVGGSAVAAVMTGGLPFAFHHPPPEVIAEDFAAASIVLLAAICFAGYCVERSWQEKVPSARRQDWVIRYCTPVLNQAFAERARRMLEWNPIAWLQQYSWRARLSKWGLCLLFVVLECAVSKGHQPGAIGPLTALLFVVLGAAYTFAGVNGFFLAKRCGALELILVSPLSVNEIIFGRVWGLWNQFLPSVIVLLASDFAGHERDVDWSLFWMKDLEIITLYLTLPIFATFCALNYRSLYVAAAMTLTAVLLPVAFGLMSGLPLHAPFLIFFVMVAGNILMGLFALDVLQSGLAQRSHPVSR